MTRIYHSLPDLKSLTNLCKYCYQPHPLKYLDAINGDVHLIYRCDNTKGLRTVFLEFIPDLDIPHTIRKKDIKKLDRLEVLKGQIPLFELSPEG